MLKKLLIFITAFASVAIANADHAFYYKLNKEAKTAIITGFDPKYTHGTVQMPLSLQVDNISYEVIGVMPHALDNMTEVTTVKIPEHYTQLGNITADRQDVRTMPDKGSAFLINCPKLEKVEFLGKKTLAKTTNAGVMTSMDGKDTYLVPPRLPMSGTQFKMSSSCTRIGAGAFAGNVSIATLSFPSNLEYVAPDAGFHLMHQISAYEIDSSNPTYQIYNGALIDRKSGTLISLPRCRYESTTYVVDYAKTSIIGDYAFANNQFIVKFEIPAAVKEIGDYAFSGSNIAQVTIYPAVDLSKKGQGAFKGCPRLTSITFKGERIDVPADFASDCLNLEHLTFSAGRPSGVGARAFRNCTKLNEFPFAADIQWRGDSIFANTGFSEVKYATSLFTEQETAAEALFADCKQLKKIDLGSVSFLNKGLKFPVTDYFASGAPQLRELIFPNFTDFSRAPFNGDNAIDKIVLSNFTKVINGVFTYTGEKEYNPKVYLRVPAGHKSASSPIHDLFSFREGAKGRVIFYCAGYESAFDADNIVWQSDIYIPGGCADNYPQWASDNEMYHIEAFGNEYIMKVTCIPALDNLKMDRVVFGKGESVEFDSKGVAIAGAAVTTVDHFTVYYTVDDVPMWTVYPSSVFSTSGIDSIATEGIPSISRTGDLIKFGTEADYTVCMTSGITIASGHASELPTFSFPKGIYILTAKRAGHTAIAKIII